MCACGAAEHRPERPATAAHEERMGVGCCAIALKDGLCSLPADAVDLEQLLCNADGRDACSDAKMAGKAAAARVEHAVAVDEHDLRHQLWRCGAQLCKERRKKRRLPESQEPADVGRCEPHKFKALVDNLQVRKADDHDGRTGIDLAALCKADVGAADERGRPGEARVVPLEDQAAQALLLA